MVKKMLKKTNREILKSKKVKDKLNGNTEVSKNYTLAN
jgi:hypothetical protein